MSKKILFFGTEDLSALALTGLISAGVKIAAVITKPDTHRGRKQELTKPAVKKIAEEYSIPVWQPLKLTEIESDIVKLGDVMGILVSYGKIIPQSILDLFTPGIINIHPSLLPLYRGPSPIESSLFHQDTQTGVSIMKLTADMDAGPVYEQIVYKLSGNESRNELYKSLGTIGTLKLIELLPSIIDATLQPIPQDHTAASYCRLLTRNDAQVDSITMTAAEIEAHTRAYFGFPGTRLTLGDIEVIIMACHVSDTPTELSVTCKNNTILAIDTLKPIGKKEMPARAFLAGYKSKL